MLYCQMPLLIQLNWIKTFYTLFGRQSSGLQRRQWITIPSLNLMSRKAVQKSKLPFSVEFLANTLPLSFIFFLLSSFLAFFNFFLFQDNKASLLKERSWWPAMKTRYPSLPEPCSLGKFVAELLKLLLREVLIAARKKLGCSINVV